MLSHVCVKIIRERPNFPLPYLAAPSESKGAYVFGGKCATSFMPYAFCNVTQVVLSFRVLRSHCLLMYFMNLMYENT